MPLLLLLFLSVLQGLTEFLPISSSGHLVLARELSGNVRLGQDITVEVALHLGTLAAVLVYFHRDWTGLLAGLWHPGAAPGALAGRERRVVFYLLVGTLPAAAAGLLVKDALEAAFTRPALVGIALLVTAAALGGTRWLAGGHRDESRLGVGRALLVGLAQALALVPGISRSGATLVAGWALGLEREAAFRFSFLLAIPAILGAAGLQLADILRGGAGRSVLSPALGGAMLVSALVGYACLVVLRRFVVNRRLHWFAGYCALAGLTALALTLGGGR